jgi:hypothetical protein
VSGGRNHLTRSELVAEIERRFAAMSEEREPMVPVIPKRASGPAPPAARSGPPEHRRVGLREELPKARQHLQPERRPKWSA